MLHIVSGMGLASLIAVVIDALALFVLPIKRSFHTLKYELVSEEKVKRQ